MTGSKKVEGAFLPGKALGVGLYSLAGVYGKKDVGEIKRMLEKAVEWGIDFFDVSDSYGPAEEILGETLRPYRKKIKIATKVGLKEGGGMDCSYQHILDSCRKSLERLQTDYIDLYQIHFNDPVTPVDKTVEALEDLRHKGLIREYGLGHLPEARIEEFARIGSPRTLITELSPVALTMYKTRLSLAKKFDLMIIAHGGTGRGLLTGKLGAKPIFQEGDIRNFDPLFRRGMYRSAGKVLDRFKKLAEKYRKTPVQVALAWTLNQERVKRVLVGPSTVEHLRENLGATGWYLQKEDLKEINNYLAEEEREKQATRINDIRDILSGKLPEDKREIVGELIYAIDGLIDADPSLEKDFFPLFQELFSWYKNGENNLERPEEIKRKLAAHIDMKV